MFTITPATVRRGRVLAAAVAAAGLLAGCGTVKAGSSADDEATMHASLTTCQTASLAVTVNTGQASALAGSTYYPVDFHNTSKPACGTAHAWLQVAVASNYPAAACKPVSAHWLRISPPQATGAGYVSFSSGA